MALFKKMDVDDNKEIDFEETKAYWRKNFPIVNARDIFSQVDANNNGVIELSEWLDFWSLLLASGHSEKILIEQIDNLSKGASWVKFKVK